MAASDNSISCLEHSDISTFWQLRLEILVYTLRRLD